MQGPASTQGRRKKQVEELFERIREEAGREIWSRGVEMVRSEAVSGASSSESEVNLLVFDRAKGLSTLVTLSPSEVDWSRDCSCKVDPCAHVAAAIIALKRAQEQGTELPRHKLPVATLEYAFRRHQGFLEFERLVCTEGGQKKELLNVPLSSLVRGQWGSHALQSQQLDLSIESLLGAERRGRLKAPAMIRLIPLLADCAVSLDGQPCKTQKEALGLTIAIRDEGLGIHVIGKRDARILETFHNGAVLSAAGLHPQADLQLSPVDLELLRHGKTFALRDIERFASEKLPEWEKRFKIENRARNLPQFVAATPELELEFSRRGDGLVVRPALVYGDPPLARIVEGVFRPLGAEVPIRDHDAERRLKDELWRQWGLELYQDRYYKTEEALRLRETLQRWRGPARGWDQLDDFRVYEGLTPAVAWREGQLSVEWQLPDETTGGRGAQRREASSEALLKAWESGQSLVPLLDGGFARLPTDWLQRYGSLMRDLLAAQAARGEMPRAALPQVVELLEANGVMAPPDLSAFSKLELLNWEELRHQPPAGFQATLRPYQEKGVAWLQHMQKLELGALLADDMGLGKTVQTIAVLPRGSLIFAPTSVLPNWQKELARFRPELKVCLYHGSQRSFDPEADVLLSSYGLLRQDQELFTGRTWSAVVLDEAQAIKNPESKVALAAQELKAQFRVALSGTPVENRLDDLWSLFAFLNPGLLGGRKDFRERWSRPIEEGQEAVAQRLRQTLKPFVLRRLKQEVAPELPPRIEKILYCELSESERQLYEAIFASSRQDLVAKLEAGASVFEALETLLRMRQACCHPALIPQQSAAHSAKLTLLLETLSTALAEGHKALVFSQWTSLLDLLEGELKAAGLDFLRLDGSTLDRQAVVERFQDEKGPPLLIMSLKAGGVGLNLTRADHVFILDPWWNPAAADQAADRAHRIGQDRPVMIHPLVALGTIEEKIMELQQRKRALAAAALGEGQATPSLTRDDLLYLLS